MGRRNKIGGQFSARLYEMLESPAWRVLSLSARRLLDRLEIEHAHHGGTENGSLVVTKQGFMDYGMDHDAIAPATREAEALGFIRLERGRGGNAEHRRPNKFFLTYATGNGSRALVPTHNWRTIKTIEEAEAIATAARAAKDPRAVQFAARNQTGKPGPKPDRKTRTEKVTFSDRKTRTEAQTGKPGLLSISRGGGGGRRPGFGEAEASAQDRCSQHVGDRERHSRKSLMTYVENVINEQLHDLDAARVRARQRTHQQLREQRLFDPVDCAKERHRGHG